MLASEHGAIRPWELEQFTPDEEHALYQRARQLAQQQQEVI
jgi:hypothetical protein